MRWIDKKNWHVTLAFLGSIDQNQLTQVFNIVGKAVSDQSSFNLTGQNIMGFPSLLNPQIVGLKNKKSQILEKIVGEIRANLNHLKIGKPDKKSFKPHITLARCKRGVGDLTAWQKYSLDSGFKVKTIEVMESILGTDSAQYSVLKSLPLKQ